MSTAVAAEDNPDMIDPPPKPRASEGEEEEKQGPMPFMWYCQRENLHVIMQKRWGYFFIWNTLVYFYHFLSVIIGMNQYVHYSRFTGCEGTEDFKGASAVFDTAILLVLIFHIIEWIRLTCLITVILVGVPWLIFYNFLSLNFPFGMIICIVAMATGFGADTSCVDAQPGRAMFLQLQILTFFLFPMWNQLPILMLKLGNIMFPPTDTDEDGKTLLYETWTQKQFEAEEEEDDD